MKKKKEIWILFMSHRCGDHGLTIHPTLKQLKKESKSVVKLIHENCEISSAQKISDKEHIDNAIDLYWGEFSDSTWFDVFRREV